MNTTQSMVYLSNSHTELLVNSVDSTGRFDLRGANLEGADLCTGDLTGADLREANLVGAE